LLVILRINRAATGVKWSPDGQKFACTSGAKSVPVCHYEEDQQWWVSKMIKKHRSTVLAVDWSPSGKFIVTGGCDFKCRIFSAFIEKIDNPDTSDYPMWDAAKQNELGEMLAEFDQAKSWVQGVSWAPSGFKVAFAGHGSTLHVADLNSGNVITTYTKDLPYHDVKFLDDDAFVATGFGLNPTIFTPNGDSYEIHKRLDPETEGESKKKTNKSAAVAQFMAADKRGISDTDKDTGDNLKTFHKNVIRSVELQRDPSGNPVALTTSATDGRLIAWSLA
jgi:actin related protein 2/3 complex subunit 1A/1B